MTQRVFKIFFFCVLRNYIPFEEIAAADGPACIPCAVPSLKIVYLRVRVYVCYNNYERITHKKVDGT